MLHWMIRLKNMKILYLVTKEVMIIRFPQHYSYETFFLVNNNMEKIKWNIVSWYCRKVEAYLLIYERFKFRILDENFLLPSFIFYTQMDIYTYWKFSINHTPFNALTLSIHCARFNLYIIFIHLSISTFNFLYTFVIFNF